MIGARRVLVMDRYFRVLLVLLAAAGAFFGLAPFLAPAQFAQLFGFAGVDTFGYRIAGAASFGYAVGLAVGFRASWRELRVPIAATAVFNLGSLLACVLAIVAGSPQWVVFLILAASLVFAPACLYFLSRLPTDRPSTPADLDHPLAQWVVGLFLIGTLAALFFGIATLLFGGDFGKMLGYPGMDSFVYRQGGAATLGAGIGGVMVLMSRNWAAARLPALMALTFNGLSVIAALLDIAAGTAQPVTYLILTAAGLVTVGSVVALMRQGR
jgi:hypothetical protein